MKAREYERLFAGTIRTAVNWRHVRASGWRVTLHTVTDRDALGAHMLPWCITGDWKAKRRKRATVAQACDRLAKWDDARRTRVLEDAARFCDDRAAALVLPAARRGGKTVLLDGCHRACALHLSGAPVHVLIAVLHVPASAGSVFDL